MTEEGDLHLQQDTARRFSTKLLMRVFRFLALCAIVLCVVQLGLIVTISFQCTKIYGATSDGDIIDTDSLTCPTPGVRQIFQHGSNIPRRSGQAGQ